MAFIVETAKADELERQYDTLGTTTKGELVVFAKQKAVDNDPLVLSYTPVVLCDAKVKGAIRVRRDKVVQYVQPMFQG
jgi:hypothetical protein